MIRLSGVVLSGVVLAGGSSRRMGTDKALLEVDGARLVDRAVGRLQLVAEDVVVASGPRRIEGLAVPQVADAWPDAGPLAGLAAGLGAARHAVVAVIACDLLHPDVDLLVGLARRLDGGVAVIPSVAGRAQPLHAVWAAGAAQGISALLDGGVRSVLQAADLLGATVLDDATTTTLATDPRWATNLNTPADLPPA